MGKLELILLVLLICALPASAGNKLKGTTALKDLQPTGTTDKSHKHQQYDFMFDAAGNQYTCRTSEKTSLKATDFVVGNNLKYEIDGDKGKLKNTSGKEVKCTVVRVENISARRK